MSLLPLFLLPLAGALAGLSAAFFGIGGGVVVTPLLYTLFPQLPPAGIISCSMGVILMNSSLNSWHFWRQNAYQSRLYLIMGIPLAGGILLSSMLVSYLTPQITKPLLGLLILAAMIHLILRTPPGPASKMAPLGKGKKLLVALCALISGIISGASGVGGGLLLIPVMTILIKAPLASLPPYLNASIAMGSLTGVISYALQTPTEPLFSNHFLENWQIGYLNPALSLFIFSGAILSSHHGARLSRQIDPALAKWLFVAMLGFFAARMLLA